MKRVFVVILNYNGFEETKNCLESLMKEDYGAIVPVIVDNDSPDGSGTRLQEKFPEVQVILNEFNWGYAGGMNTGARYALAQGADYVVYVNNDAEFCGDAISQMVLTAEKDVKTGIVSPKVLYLDEKDKIYCAGSSYNFWRCGNVSLGKGRSASENCNEELYISHAEGACLLIKREVFEQCGFMSEFYFMYFEDLDFSLRVSKHFRIKYNPKALVYHQSGAGKTFEQYSKLYHYYFTRNRFIIFRNHSVFEKIYVILYSAAITILKSFAIIKGASDKMATLKAIWGGYITGLGYITGFTKIESDKPIVKEDIRTKIE
ncbi:MAG: glycosyltransferase family 2 protein [Ignavibacteriales bacterium]|nr:glycosyltransferase family 2 protein [Ignavibacteriales bacterium]